MLKTMMNPDAFMTNAIGEADAWDEPRWPEHETYGSDYERAAASFHEPNIDMPADRCGGFRRPSDPAAAYRAAQAYGRADLATANPYEPRGVPREAFRGDRMHSETMRDEAMRCETPRGAGAVRGAAMRGEPAAPSPHRAAQVRYAEPRPPSYARALPDHHGSEPARGYGGPVQAALPSAARAEPGSATSTMNDFRTLAQTIERMRGQQRPEPAAAASEPAGRQSWLDDVRHSLQSSASPTAERPRQLDYARTAPEARIEDEGVRRSLATLTNEIGALANKAELDRLETALADVVRRVTSLETRLREAKAPPQLITRPSPTIVSKAPPPAAKAPPRLTAELIDARVAERRRGAIATERGASAPERRERQTRQVAETPAYEPREPGAPRRLFR